MNEAGIQEVMMVNLNTSLTLSILEMIIEFSPYLFLGLVEVGSRRFEDFNALVFLLVLEQIRLLARGWCLTLGKARIVADSTGLTHLCF